MTDPVPLRGLTCLAIVLAVVVIALGGFLGFAAQASLADPMTTPGSWSQWWGLCAAAAAVCSALVLCHSWFDGCYLPCSRSRKTD
jgi:hypothetical protein